MREMEQKPRPRGRPFPKGVSGNPKGRIPGKKTHDTIISEATRRGLEHMVGDGTLTAAEALAHRRIEIGLRAKPGIALQAIEGIENRMEGRPTQAIEVHQKIDTDTAERLLAIAHLIAPIVRSTTKRTDLVGPPPALQSEPKFLAAESTQLEQASGIKPEGK